MKWFRRRRRVQPEADYGPALVGDTWMDSRTQQPSTWQEVRATWRRRLDVLTHTVARGFATAVGVETRSGTERRAITSVPWSDGSGSSVGRVSVERALQLGPVFAAGRLLASSVASLPVKQYRAGSDGSRTRLPLASLFVQPSAVGTLHDWIFRAMTSMVYRGNAIGLVTARDANEYATAVEWLHPDWVTVIDTLLYGPGSFTNPLWYVLGKPVPAEDIVHIPWFPVAGKVWGLSPIGAYAATVATGLAAQEYSADWFNSGGVPPGTFQNENQTVEEADAQIVKQRLVQAIRSHEPIVYGKDWKYNPISIPPNEARFIETMQLTATQIAAIYGIPPEKIGGTSGHSLTYANVEQQSIDFVQFTLLGWLTKLEDALSGLLPRGQYMKFNVDALIRVDIATRYEVYEKSRLIGKNNIDEIRAQEDEPPLPNGEGKDYTALPILAGAKVAVPYIRDDGSTRLRVVADSEREIDNG